ncbi:MAG TPA: glycoside hydrolase family 88 protein [Opitutaceae bacterium]|jgi:rhamnogalacturonyl hydrolase YesR
MSRTLAAACTLALAGACQARAAQARLSPSEILTTLEKVADWQLAHPSAHPATDWTQAAGDAGMMALAGISGSPRYEDAMLAMAERNGWQLGPRMYHADDHCVGQTYAELYLLYRDPRMIAPMRRTFDAILAAPPPVKSLEFSYQNRATDLWSWCDSLFMGPPAWMRLYAATGDARYMDYAVKNWWRTTDYLYDKDEHLFYRDSTYFKKVEANGRKVFWSRGNGWVMAGLARLLQSLPSNHPDRPRFEALFRDMAATVVACQQEDGLWRASLLDPASYPLRETSGSGFFTYALAWGANQGLLPGDCGAAARRGWAALVACAGPDGRLAHVQPIGADPRKFDEGATEVYGVGAFLLAGSEVYRMSILERHAPTRVTVANPSGFYRACETVEVDPRGFGSGRLVVMDSASSRVLDSQTYASEPGGPEDKLLFQVDLPPGGSATFDVFNATDRAPWSPRPHVKTYAREVAERYHDMAWESDRIAHRMYNVELIKGEGTVSSGIDVWTKRTRALVIDEWYRRPNYHRDDGDGLDDYQVGRSRGCGGLGIWVAGRLYVSSNFTAARVITTGPVRSVFELTYAPWDAAGRKVSEIKRIAIDAGSNMSVAESTFTADGAAPLEVGVGIARRADPRAEEAADREAGWMTCWQAPDRDRGQIGCAVALVPGSVRQIVAEDASVPPVPEARRLVPGNEGIPPIGNRLAITSVAPGQTLRYSFGAGWSKSGDFPTGADWVAYVRRYADRERAPLKVGVALPPAG